MAAFEIVSVADILVSVLDVIDSFIDWFLWLDLELVAAVDSSVDTDEGEVFVSTPGAPFASSSKRFCKVEEFVQLKLLHQMYGLSVLESQSTT